MLEHREWKRYLSSGKRGFCVCDIQPVQNVGYIGGCSVCFRQSGMIGMVEICNSLLRSEGRTE
jgi:hypothetical protein